MQVSATEEDQAGRKFSGEFLPGPVAHRALSKTIDARPFSEPHTTIDDAGWRISDVEIVFAVTTRRNGLAARRWLYGVRITSEGTIRVEDYDRYLLHSYDPEDLTE